MDIELRVPTEPRALGDQLRTALLDGASWEQRFGTDLGIGQVLWAAWEEQLSGEGGLTRDGFEVTVRGARRELWLWVLGDRTWQQVATGIAGRLRRRMSAVTSA